MKKKILVASIIMAMAGSASAQNDVMPPKPPKPPKPPLVKPMVPPPPPPEIAPPPPPAPPIISAEQVGLLPEDYQQFLKKNPTVGSLRWNKEAVWVMLKNGKEERYLLNESGTKEVEAKYGKLPASPPPPPPPPPPLAPKKSKRTLS